MPVPAMSSARCGASCAASTNSSAPWRCAASASSASGQTSPVTFDAPRDREQAEPPARAAERPLDPVEQRVGGVRARQQAQPVPAPRQQVRVMLGRGREHARPGRKRGGEHVDGLGRVAHEDDLVARVAAGEAAHDAAGALERLRRDLRLQPAPAVHAAVPRQEGVDRVADRCQRGRARGVVEVRVAARRPSRHSTSTSAPTRSGGAVAAGVGMSMTRSFARGTVQPTVRARVRPAPPGDPWISPCHRVAASGPAAVPRGSVQGVPATSALPGRRSVGAPLPRPQEGAIHEAHPHRVRGGHRRGAAGRAPARPRPRRSGCPRSR